MKRKKIVFVLFSVLVCNVFFCVGCKENPLTGKKTMAFVSNSYLFPVSFLQYKQFIAEHTVVSGTADAAMVERVGGKIKQAAEKWFIAGNSSDYLDGYEWEYTLVDSDEVNAWCMPGGKIVVYTGILPITKNEDALAAVLGHEVAHALLNHSQQQMSAEVLQQLGAVGLMLVMGDSSAEAQQAAQVLYGAGSQLLGTLPFSRAHETEADRYGLILMAIAGYNVEEAVEFWERMNALGNEGFEFLGTHPSSSTRISALKALIPEATAKAKEVNKEQ